MPSPYYSDDHVTIYHGDCRDVLPHLDLVDLVFTSPPYNKGDTGGRVWSRLDQNGYGDHDDRMPETEYVQWQQKIIRACYDTLTPTGALFYQHRPIAKGPDLLLPTRLIPPRVPLRQIITWDRGSGFQRDGVHLCPSYEWILVLARPGWRVADRSMFDLWRVPPNHDAEHPASFPLQLPKLGIRAGNAQTVLDPFAGSGTTLRAAKDLGRRAIGIEISEEYCEVAARRMGQEVLPLEV